MGQRDQGRNQKIPWNERKWEHKNLKSVGHEESSSKKEIHSIIGLSQETKTRLK